MSNSLVRTFFALLAGALALVLGISLGRSRLEPSGRRRPPRRPRTSTTSRSTASRPTTPLPSTVPRSQPNKRVIPQFSAPSASGRTALRRARGPSPSSVTPFTTANVCLRTSARMPLRLVLASRAPTASLRVSSRRVLPQRQDRPDGGWVMASMPARGRVTVRPGPASARDSRRTLQRTRSSLVSGMMQTWL